MNGCISGLYTLNPLTYDADIRSTGVGWSIGIGRIGAILAPMIAGRLLDMAGTNRAYMLALASLC